MHRSLLDQLVGGAVSVLLAALALYIAARLIEAVWQIIAIVGGIVVFAAALIAVTRWMVNRRGW